MACSDSISVSPDRPCINEEHLQRLSRVPRTTRIAWAKAGLLDKQTSPYSLTQLREVVTVAELRTALGPASGEVVFRQLRSRLPAPDASAVEALIDLHTLHAEWVADNDAIAAAARKGDAIQLVDLTDRLARASEGFALAARSARVSDELAPRRGRTRAPRRRQRANPSE